jgi:RNA polymerase sigma factor (sigma-70 family)
MGTIMTIHTENELIRKYQETGDVEVRNKVIMTHYGSLVLTARKLRRDEAIIPDLIQEGILGLIKAMDSFDLSKNLKFITFGMTIAKYWMMKYLIENHSVVPFANKSDAFRKIFFRFHTMDDPYNISGKELKSSSESMGVKEEELIRFLLYNNGEFGEWCKTALDKRENNPEYIAMMEEICVKADKKLKQFPSTIEKGIRYKFQETNTAYNPEMRKIEKEAGYSRWGFDRVINAHIKKIHNSLFKEGYHCEKVLY